MVPGRRILVAVFMLLLANQPTSDAHAVETVVVDVGSDAGPVSFKASGILHASTYSDTVSDRNLLEPLQPRLFRDAPRYAAEFYSYFQALGAMQHSMLSEPPAYAGGAWGYPSTGETTFPGDGGQLVGGSWVGGDFSQWQANIRQIVQADIDAGRTDLVYDIWNEPNGVDYWGRSAAQAWETWYQGYLAVRSVAPGALIAGPSVSWMDRGWVEGFLQYMKARNALPDIFTWHVLGDDAGSVKSDADYITAFMTTNDVIVPNTGRIPRLHLNEYDSEASNHQPGPAVGYIAQIERSTIERASRSCWPFSGVPTGVAYCGLNGLIEFSSRRPDSAWYAYRRYANLRGRMVRVTPTAHIDGVAAYDGIKVRGVFGRAVFSPTSDVAVTFVGLPFAVARVVVERLAYSGFDASPGPIVVLDATRAVSNGRLTVTVSAIGSLDAFMVRVEPSDGTPPPPALTITSGPRGNPNPVVSEGWVRLIVGAADSLDDEPTYAWSASCPTLESDGAFSDRTGQNPTWSAPANAADSPQECTIAVTVSDSQGLSRWASYRQAVASANSPSLAVRANQTLFHPGDTMIVTATLAPGTIATRVDAYIVVQLPDGRFVSLQIGPAVPGLVPIATNFIPQPFTGEVLRYTFTGEEPTGTYSWLGGVTAPGTLSILGGLQELPVTFVVSQPDKAQTP